MDAVSSVMSSTNSSPGVRKRRSAATGTAGVVKDSLKQKPGHSVTVETAVFIDETLYDIMRKTFAGLSLFPCPSNPHDDCCDRLPPLLCLHMIYDVFVCFQSGGSDSQLKRQVGKQGLELMFCCTLFFLFS